MISDRIATDLESSFFLFPDFLYPVKENIDKVLLSKTSHSVDP